eukprot:scaffold11699_cov109-Isochrysis_galbana.AAC.9
MAAVTASAATPASRAASTEARAATKSNCRGGARASSSIRRRASTRAACACLAAATCASPRVRSASAAPTARAAASAAAASGMSTSDGGVSSSKARTAEAFAHAACAFAAASIWRAWSVHTAASTPRERAAPSASLAAVTSSASGSADVNARSAALASAWPACAATASSTRAAADANSKSATPAARAASTAARAASTGSARLGASHSLTSLLCAASRRSCASAAAANTSLARVSTSAATPHARARSTSRRAELNSSASAEPVIIVCRAAAAPSRASCLWLASACRCRAALERADCGHALHLLPRRLSALLSLLSPAHVLSRTRHERRLYPRPLRLLQGHPGLLDGNREQCHVHELIQRRRCRRARLLPLLRRFDQAGCSTERSRFHPRVLRPCHCRPRVLEVYFEWRRGSHLDEGGGLFCTPLDGLELLLVPLQERHLLCCQPHRALQRLDCRGRLTVVVAHFGPQLFHAGNHAIAPAEEFADPLRGFQCLRPSHALTPLLAGRLGFRRAGLVAAIVHQICAVGLRHVQASLHSKHHLWR